MLLNDFGSYREAIDYAEKSNEIFLKKEEGKYVEAMMTNNLIIAQSKNKLGDSSEALKRSEALFNSVSKITEWQQGLATFIIESVKIPFELLTKEIKDSDKLNRVYYVLEMFKSSFGHLEVTKSKEKLETLKMTIINNKSPTNLIRSILSELESREGVYDVDMLVNTTFQQFIARQEPPAKDNIVRTMQNLLLVYECLGSDFLINSVRPVS